MKPRVILIREWESQMSGSDCCGRLQGDLLEVGGRRLFPERRRLMEAMGPLYRAIRDRYGDAVDLMVVDPRNWVSLVVRLLGDFRRYHVSLGEAWRTLRAISTVSVVIDGRLVARGVWPEADTVFRLIDARTSPAHAAG